MKKISRLPSHVVAKIAAGEVIERPAYAVKELIENALDASATIIEIQIEESGLKRITVIDNGQGMSKEDLEICFLPHTTSKIRTDEDLLGIATLGFRGEALASITAISHVTIITRTAKDIGGRIIQIRGGIVEDSAPIGSPIGTIVTAEGLFYSVPARKKFLKSAQTEFRHITEMVARFALMYPDIHFVLEHNRKTVLEYPKKNTSHERIVSVMGSSLVDELLPVELEDGSTQISGMVGRPQASLKQNQKQFLFINNRHVTDRMLSLAVREAFGTLLPASHTPVFLLSLTLPHEIVDVNIHPRKEQVAITGQKEIFDVVKQAVLKTLSENNITFQLAKFKQEHSAKLGYTTSASGSVIKETVLPWNRNDAILLNKEEFYEQILQTYIFSYTQDRIFFIDQHAAHERILYNLMLTEFHKQSMNHITLPEALSIELSVSDAQLLEEYNENLHKLGFQIEHFQGNSFILRTIPTVLQGRRYEKIILEILNDVKEEKNQQLLDSGSHRMLTFLACRAAAKAGDILSKSEMKHMVSELEKTQNNETCPHGRPTTLTLPITELNKKFRR